MLITMAFFRKKREEDELPPIPEGLDSTELPPLPPMPGEEEMLTPPAMPRMPRMARPMPDFQMPAPMPQMPAMPSAERATVFVRIDKYKDVMRTIDSMHAKMDELRSTLDKISMIKGKEAEIIDGWNALLSEAKSKLDEASAKMLKPSEE